MVVFTDPDASRSLTVVFFRKTCTFTTPHPDMGVTCVATNTTARLGATSIAEMCGAVVVKSSNAPVSVTLMVSTRLCWFSFPGASGLNRCLLVAPPATPIGIAVSLR